MIPLSIFSVWLWGILALAAWAGAIYCGHEWYAGSWTWDAAAGRSAFDPAFGFNGATALLAVSVTLALISTAGRPVILGFLRLASPSSKDPDPDPRHSTLPVAQHSISRPDGSRLHVETYGPPHGIPIVATHGWGLGSTEWNYLKRSLPPGHRLVVWDLPGLGKSRAPDNRDFSLEKLAGDLAAVMDHAGAPCILVGHSIGGMITLTRLGMSPQEGGGKVIAVVLAHTTPTNPVRTTSGASWLTALQNPVLKPLLYLTIAAAPLVRFMNLLSHANGSTLLSNKFTSFAGEETWQQVDFLSRFQRQASPAVLARGMLAMMRYDATAVLTRIFVPTLIVAGNKDGTTKPEASEAMHAAIPKSRMLMLKPAKHLGIIGHHSQFEAAVKSFVDRRGESVPITVARGTT